MSTAENTPRARTARQFAVGTRVRHNSFGLGTVRDDRYSRLYPLFDNGTVGTPSTRVWSVEAERTPKGGAAPAPSASVPAPKKGSGAPRTRAARVARDRQIDGYRTPGYTVTDNGAGMGPTRGAGRWAISTDTGRWLANVDTIADARAYIAELSA